jgi:L-alanine-DL-glutamate epimerase-like enolase superfamily enzyme
MNTRVSDYFLEFRDPFAIAHGTRTGTDLVFLELEMDGCTGIGEASLPPYLKETQRSVKEFISRFFLENRDEPAMLEGWLAALHRKGTGNYAAKACIDIALHNLFARRMGTSLAAMLQLPLSPVPDCTFTIGMDHPDAIARKLEAAGDFSVLKIKLGGANDRDLMRAIRSCTSKPVCVDVNQGWRDRQQALDMIEFLASQNVMFVEQPLPVSSVSDQEWLVDRSPLPLYADESAQVPADVPGLKGLFHGINVKLMKCGGIAQARIMIEAARADGFKVLLGSMSESGIGIAAAAALAPLADLVDLDGPLLTKNNPYDMVEYKAGKVFLR